MADPKNDPKSGSAKTSEKAETEHKSSTGTVNKSVMDPKNASSVGAVVSEEAEVKDGVLDAGGPYVAAAPAPTPAEKVAYPATGGLPDTGPHSKYVAGDNRGVELYDKDGNRVDRDGHRLNEFGDRDYDPPRPEDAKKPIPAAIQAEMDRGKQALSRN